MITFSALALLLLVDERWLLAGEAVVINTASPIAALSATASQMTAQGHGTIIVLSSVAGVRVRSDNRVYGASKSGLDSYALALANELDDTGVEITVVRPGFVHGRMTDGMKLAPFSTDPRPSLWQRIMPWPPVAEWCGFHGTYNSCSQSSESCLTRSGVEYGADAERHFSPRPGA